jgi:hypothetical protein
MKLSLAMILSGGVIALVGCAHPDYSYDVRANGEGGVIVTTVPFREEPWRQAPQPTIIYVHDAATTQPVTLPAVATPAPAPAPAPETAPPATVPAGEPSVSELEARVKALEDENARLKQQVPTTAPATMPAMQP